MAGGNGTPKYTPTKRQAPGQKHAAERARKAKERGLSARTRSRRPADQQGEGAYQPFRKRPESQSSKAATLKALGKVRGKSPTPITVIMDSKLSDETKRRAIRKLGAGKGGPKEG
jgi:hypothetical protein